MESKFSVFGERGIGGKIGLSKRVERGSVNFGCGVQEIRNGREGDDKFLERISVGRFLSDGATWECVQAKVGFGDGRSKGSLSCCVRAAIPDQDILRAQARG